MTLRFIICTLLTLAAARLTIAQPDTLWSALPVFTGNSIFYGGTACANGDFVLVGSIDNGDASSQDMLIVRLADNGDVLWTTRPTSGFEDVDQASAVVELPTGELRVSGWSANSYTLNVLDLDGNGNLIRVWNYTTPGGRAKGTDIDDSPSGALGVAGYGYGGVSNGSDAWMLHKSAGGDTAWSIMPHGSGTDVFATIEFRDDYFVLTGYDFTAPDYDLWIAKYDTTLSWSLNETYGEANDQLSYAAAVSASGQIYAGGRTGDLPYLLKANSSLEQVWARDDYFAAGTSGHIRGVAMYRDELPLCVGWKNVAGARHCWIMLADSSGDSLWSWDYAVGDTAGLYGIERLNCGGYLAFGYAMDGARARAYVLRIAPDQGVLGTVRNSAGDALSGIRVQAAGESCAAISGGAGQFVLGLDPGSYRLVYAGDCIESDTTATITIAADNLLEYSVTVREPALGALPTSLNLVAANHVAATGTLELHNLGDGALDYSIDVQMIDPGHGWLSVTPATGRIAASSSTELQITVTADTTDDGVYEFFGQLIVRSNACPDTAERIPVFVTVLDADDPATVVREFSVSEVYPNPFNGQTSLELLLPRASGVRLRLFDVTGRTVREQEFGELSAGSHRLPLDLSELATGVYFARVRAGEFSAVRKLMLAK